MNNKIKDVLINILLFIVLVLLLLVPAYFCYKIFLVDTKDNKNQQENTDIQAQEEETEEEQTVEQGDPYQEYFPILEDQQSYVVVPSKIDDKNPPVLILYSHGSNTTVTQNMQDQFMMDLQEYGKYFTQHNYIFAASNQHGVNWGNEASIRDTLNLKQWVMQNYNIKPQVYMIGFSMGGLPTMNFASQNSELVGKIALLAPTTRTSEWNIQRAEKIKDIEIKIWHGSADVNVSYNSAMNFVNTMKKWGKGITMVTLEGKTHFDVDTEYMEEILEFFNE